MTSPNDTADMGTRKLVLPLRIVKHSNTDYAVSIRDGDDLWLASCDAHMAPALIDACNSHAALQAQLAEARKVLAEAIEDIESWAEYASDYFQEKHGLPACLAKHRAALASLGRAP